MTLSKNLGECQAPWTKMIVFIDMAVQQTARCDGDGQPLYAENRPIENVLASEIGKQE